jgi:hypothetical protein
MERFRILIMQIITSIAIILLAVWSCFRVIFNNSRIIDRFHSLGFNYESVEFGALLIAIVYICFLSMELILWFWKKPKLIHRKKKPKKVEKIDMGRVKVGKYTNK